MCEILSADVTPLADPELFRCWMDRMPETRKRKVMSMRFAEGQRQSLGAGILLFQAMRKRGLDGTRAEIRTGRFEKPFLPAYPDFQFSLSHSGERVLCAVCDSPVGCDVERAGRNLVQLARRFFHPEEQAALEEASEDRRNALFIRIWTMKESYLKATGTGMSAPLNGFSALSPAQGVWYDEGPAPDGYAASCCVFREERPAFLWREIMLESE